MLNLHELAWPTLGQVRWTCQLGVRPDQPWMAVMRKPSASWLLNVLFVEVRCQMSTNRVAHGSDEVPQVRTRQSA
jgi:hypothetical protein